MKNQKNIKEDFWRMNKDLKSFNDNCNKYFYCTTRPYKELLSEEKEIIETNNNLTYFQFVDNIFDDKNFLSSNKNTVWIIPQKPYHIPKSINVK